jgi:RHS repeat-associated protein
VSRPPPRFTTPPGAPATVTDANGSTSYTYDGTDAAGKTERRGLATKVDVTTAGSTWSSTGAYDADGAVTIQKLPGGITQTTELDNAGEPVGLRYSGQVTTVNGDGTTTVDPNGGWLSWSIDNDVTGRVAREWTPDGAAFTGPAGDAPGDAIPYDRAYSYDPAGRLTQVRDRTAAATGVDITDPTVTPCITRTYGFDRNDNRLTKNTTISGADGACTTTGGTSVTRAFDTADRPVTGANGVGSYAYDLLGRTTALPASDAPKPADGNVTLGYYDNDLARSITQGGTTTTFTLDALDRRSVETVTNTAGSTQAVRHYTDTSDNPAWVTTGTTWQRYAELIGGDLALTISSSSDADLTLANNHGDIVTTITLPAAGTAATSIDGWNNYDEYGNPNTTNNAGTGAIDYGWLGAKQRAVTGAGLTLMGVRLYNRVTGTFTSTDPVSGGGANAYATDPLNQFDLDGRKWWRSKKFRNVMTSIGKWSGYASYIPGPIGIWASGVSAGAYFAAGERRKGLAALTGFGLGKTASFVIRKAIRPTYVNKFGRSAWHARSWGKHKKRSRFYSARQRVFYNGRIRSPRNYVHASAYANRVTAQYGFGAD